MNHPASKEPTMDEILSSIRQIIADDDEAVARKAESQPAPARPVPQSPAPFSAPRAAAAIDPFADEDDEELAPLALSPEQIVADAEPALQAEPVPQAEPAPQPAASRPQAAAPQLVVADDVAFAEDRDPEPAPAREDAPRADFGNAPMPDPTLSAELAEQLLGPATDAAVRDAFSKLRAPRLAPGTPLSAGGLTIEALLREMLRPMLKDWLDEHLPAMVERMVEEEIARVSRGG